MLIHDIADFLVNLTCKDIKPDIYSVFESPCENNCPNNVNSEKLTILEILNAIGCRLKNLFGFVKINTTTETIDEGEAVVNVNGDVDNLNFDFKIPRGKPGQQGPAGPGVAAGGTTGQVLAKKSNASFDTEWIDFYPYVPVGGIIEWDGTDIPKAPDLTTPEKVAAFYGYGTWERYGTDRVTVGAGGAYNAGSIGGEKEHTLNIAEMPSHQHQLHGWAIGIQGSESTQYAPTYPYDQYDNTNLTTRPVGDGQPHNNMQPYIGTYRYRRIA